MLNAQNVRGCEPRFKPNSKLCFKTLIKIIFLSNL
ncbi:hypothetical protein HCCG_00416 [Helicobacter cinaedi CCUG 18818 = ATCC BAA-847]|uniref:Uncharacterized protein n=1 Tax=Helicobacter cinaedi CCUG 18818 = ATCC BAA-847 TaxID=537971 RepID=A0ABN0B8L8_9HELI|nr:hypothetical protein HCCG_00416 [Helicobacter cinaedi CCUG 18818 = ATCC BAA-847]